MKLTTKALNTRAMRRDLVCVLLLGAICLVACSSETTIHMATPAVDWQPVDSLNARLPDGLAVYEGVDASWPLKAWYIHAQISKSQIEAQVLISDDAQDLRETVSSFARDEGACAAVNAGYFVMNRTPSRHVGLLYIDGNLHEPATPSVVRDSLRYPIARAAIGFTEDGAPDIAWASTRDGLLYAWSEPVANQPGSPVDSLNYATAEVWPMRDAVAAGPALVMDGRVHVTTYEEVFFGTSIPQTHPRSAAGITRKGDLILMVVDGRQPASRGVTLKELAELMRERGAVEALNLDGGGSSTLVVNNVLMNRPTGSEFEREVMSALAIFCGKDSAGTNVGEN